MIHLTNDKGEPILVNPASLSVVEPHGKGSRLWFGTPSRQDVKEPVAVVLERIEAAGLVSLR